MEKLLTEILDCNISAQMPLLNENTASVLADFCTNVNKTPKNLSACVKFFSKINDIENDLSKVYFCFNDIIINEELSNRKVREIAFELAQAIDENSVEKVKALKNKYGNEKEFATAKNFLNKKCKEVWDVFETKNKVIKAPYEAMKILGITNRPNLSFVLEDSLRYYEKNNNSTSANIISNILKNKNLSYSMEDIHNFLKKMHEKENINYNFKTVSYLISEQNYDREKLTQLGVNKQTLHLALNELTFTQKLRYTFKNVFTKSLQINRILLKIINNINTLRRF